MTTRRLAVFALLAALACGDPVNPGTVLPRLAAVNGGISPALLPGREFTLVGERFGAEQGEQAVRVTTAGGTAAVEIVSWSDNAVVARLPDDAVSGTMVLVRARGDTLGPVPLFVRAREPFDPAGLSWQPGPDLPRTLAAATPAPLRYPAGSTVHSLLALFGGAADSGPVTDSTYLGFDNGTGGLERWVAAPQDSAIPASRRFHALAGADRTNAPLDSVEAVAYLIAGLDSTGLPVANVSGIGVRRTGDYSLWTPLTPLPERRAGAASLVAFGAIIVAGGFGADSLARSDVFIASIQPTGEINGWFRGPSLPEPRAFGALVLLDETLFFVGGQTGLVPPDSIDPASADLRATVWSAPLSRRSGFFLADSWTAVASLLEPRTRHAAFGLDGGLLVTGGVHPAGPGAESEFAAVAPDGTIGAFAGLGATSIADLGGGALRDVLYATVWDARGVPHPLIAGGRDAQGALRRATWWH